MSSRALEHARWEIATGAPVIAVEVSGDLVLPMPGLQLSGSLSVAFGALSGALVLPSLQLVGSEVTTFRALNGALALPSLQLSGVLTVPASKIAAWLRLAASTINAGEYDTVVDALNANPTNQAGAARKPAAATLIDGLPIATWDGTDVLVWPVHASNNQTTKLGVAFWLRVASVAPDPVVLVDMTGGTVGYKLSIQLSGSQLRVLCFLAAGGYVGRSAATPVGTIIANDFQWIRVEYDSSRGGDANVRVYVNEVLIALTFSNIGAGGTLTTLPSVTGNVLIGGQSNSDTPFYSPVGDLGPNLLWLNDNPTAAEAAAWMAFDAPLMPYRFGKISSWPRLASSTAVSGEWPTIADVFNPASPMAQPSANRKAAVGAGINCQTMVLDGSDMHTIPASANTFSTTKFGYAFWLKPATVSGTQTFLFAPANGAVLQLYMVGAGFQFTILMDAGATKGRNATVSNVLTAGAWHHIYWQYDSSRGGDANEALYINGVSVALTYSNQGIGQALGVLQPITGSILWFAGSNSDSPASAFANGTEVTPPITLTDNLTAAELAALMAYEAPCLVAAGIAITAVTCWYRNSIAGAVNSLPDLLNASNPGVQATAARQPTGQQADLSMSFDGNDAIGVPLIPQNNGAVCFGFGFWINPILSDATDIPYSATIGGGASAQKFELQMFPNGSASVPLLVSGAASMSAGSLVAATAKFLSVEYNGNRASGSRWKWFVDGVDRSSSDSTPAAITAPTGTMVWGARDVTGGVGFNGAIGRNIFVYGSEMVGSTSGLLTAAARAALRALDPLFVFDACTITLPSLQLTGTFTVGASPHFAWLRLAASTIDPANGGEYSDFANIIVPSNPTNQPGAARRPAAAVSTNGLPVALWDGTDVLLWPLVTSNNDPGVFCLHLHIKMTDVGSRQRLVSGNLPTMAPRLIIDVVTSGIMIEAHSTTADGVQYTKTNVLSTNLWTSCFFIVNPAGATNDDKLQCWIEGTKLSAPTFTNLGTGALAALAVSSGSYTLGAAANTDTPGQAFANGSYTGPNWHFLSVVPTAAQIAAYANFDRPT